MQYRQRLSQIAALVVMLAASFAFAGASNDWEIVSKGDQYRLVAKGMPSIPLIHNGMPVLERVEQYAGHLVRITYNSGDYGTFTMTRVHRAVVVDPRRKKVLGDFPIQYDVLSGRTKPVEQPVWKLDEQAGTLRVTDEESGLDETVSVK